MKFVDKLRPYGDLVFFRAFGYRIYVANHPQLIREVLISKRDAFRKTPRDTRAVRQLLGNGVLVSEGDLWLRQRRLLQKAFHQSRMDRYAAVVVEQTLKTLEGWRSGSALDVAEEMTDLTLRIAARSMLDLRLDERSVELTRAARTLSEQFSHEARAFFTLPEWLRLPRHRRKRWAMEVYDRLIREIIADRRLTREDPGDLLSILLNAVDDQGDGRGMTDLQARDEALTLFIAAFHAASMALTWTWYLLSEHSQIEARVREEVDRVLGERVATLNDLPALQYTRMAVQESMRLYPPAWGLFCRQAVRDVELGGYHLRRGSWVFLWPYLTQRDERFFPQPLRFDPERFSPAREKEIPPGAYFPFGAGPRTCIGESFAMMELPLILATVAQRYRLLRLPGNRRIEAEAVLNIRPRGGLPMWIEAYRPSPAAGGSAGKLVIAHR